METPRAVGLRTLARLFPYYRPYRGQLFGGLVCVIIASASASAIPTLLSKGLDGLRAGHPLAEAWRIGAVMVAVTLGTGALRYLMREMMNGLSRWVEYDLRNALFARLLVLDANWFARMRTGDIMARLTNDLGAVRMAAGPAIMYLANTVFGGLFALWCMSRIDLTLAGLAVLPALAIPVMMVRLGKKVHDRFEAVQEHYSTLSTRAQENLAGSRVVRAYRQEASEVARFTALGEEYLRRNMALTRLNGFMHPMFTLLAGLGAVIVLGLGGRLALAGTISIGNFVAFGIYLGMLTWPLIALGWVINLFQRGAASMARLLDILDAEPQVTTPSEPVALPARAHGGRTIEFRGVGFHYPVKDGEAPRWVLRDVSFTLPAGQTLGIVGAIGAGKSALLDLVPRFFDPQEGTILVDGVPLAQCDLAALRREIGMVPQESLLFSETIEQNLRYGLEDDAAASAAEAVTWASRMAQLDETVRGFADGYRTQLGERGINLSGGQKQRAALARALARHPSIVLLDDALSAVDTHTEAEILRGLREAFAGRTALIASHRISAIRDADHILVIDGGRVVEQGRHEALLAQKGRYWALLRRQQLADSVDAEEDASAIGDAHAPAIGDAHAPAMEADAGLAGA
ncbi:MAG: ABC transporter ATP-binding protein [Gemmatimonadetes bacterium]|nr:ABC transporter ATP-binding protein [Gemmatimonadota bacterium]